jgi:hypothetical protein
MSFAHLMILLLRVKVKNKTCGIISGSEASKNERSSFNDFTLETEFLEES